MKKRVVSALLAAVLCIGLLGACGSKDNKKDETTKVETTAAKEKTITSIKGVKFNVPNDWTSLESQKS